MTEISPEHQFLRAELWEKWTEIQTDPKRGLTALLLQKPFTSDRSPIELTTPDQFQVGGTPLKVNLPEPDEKGVVS
jgi:hypothetical protein